MLRNCILVVRFLRESELASQASSKKCFLKPTCAKPLVFQMKRDTQNFRHEKGLDVGWYF